MKPGNPIDLSVVINTWNNARRLGITLDAISQLRIPEGLAWEVVVVNNNCTDDTDAVAARFESRLPLVYVHEPRQGVSLAKNAGVRASRGRLIVFTDDDVRPCPDWLDIYWEAHQRLGPGYFLGGPIESEFEAGPPHPDLIPMAPPSVKGFRRPDHPHQVESRSPFLGANWACPREAVERAGGFDTGMGPHADGPQCGEESQMMWRLIDAGMKPWYLPDALVHHFVPAAKCTAAHIIRRQRNVAQAFEREKLRTTSGPTKTVTLGTRIAAARLCLRWLTARLLGRTGYKELLAWQQFLGVMDAMRQAQARHDKTGSGADQ